MKYQVTTYYSGFNKSQKIELSDQSYGEWIIYENRLPKYHVNLFDKSNESNKLLFELINNKGIDFEKILDQINKENNAHLCLTNDNIFYLWKRTITQELRLPPIPVNFINRNKLDLEEYRSNILRLIERTITEYKKLGVRAETLGIYVNPSNGWISTNIQTSWDENTELNCPDFDLVEFDIVNFPKWHEAYQSFEAVKITFANFESTVERGFNDDDFNKPFFIFMSQIINENRNTFDTHRIFLQFLDSQYEEIIK